MIGNLVVVVLIAIVVAYICWDAKNVDRAGLSWPHNANWKKR